MLSLNSFFGKTIHLVLLLIVCHSTFSQGIDMFKDLKVKTLEDQEVLLHDVLRGEKNQQIILYLYTSNCSPCINTIDQLQAINPELSERSQVRLITLNTIWDEDLQETVKGWEYESYYSDDMSFYRTFGEVRTPLSMVFMNGKLLYNFTGFKGAEKTLKAILKSHPYVRHFLQEGNSDALPVPKEEANMLYHLNPFPEGDEVVLRTYENNAPGEILSINNPNAIPKTADSLYIDGVYYGRIQGNLVLVKNGKIGGNYKGLESRTEVTYFNEEGAEIEKDNSQVNYYKITDRFVPQTIDFDKSLDERTVFRRAELRDMDDNLISYELWKGVHDELLEKHDFSNQPVFHSPEDGIAPVEVEIIEDETEVEETEIEEASETDYSENSVLTADLISKDNLNSWVDSFGLEKLKYEAKQENPIAQRRLGRYHRFVKDNQAEAFYWFKKSAVNRDYFGLVNLASAYQTGRGTDKNKEEAIKWFLEAMKIEEGNQSSATWGLRDIKGLEWTNKQKLDWYLKAAPEGNPLAQYNLARFYEKGIAGLEKSLLKAINWHTKAAERGYKPAQNRLKEIEKTIGN